MYDEFEIKY